MLGRTISHFKILSELGAGGMGVVYAAEDSRLKRRVALKFLPAALSSDEEAKRRFFQEAQAASALNHANICTVYDVGETEDGAPWIAMAHYEGQTLQEIVQSGAMAESEVIQIAVQLASGLAAAHNAGIIHRDIKPANVFRTDSGRIVILDFGVAKLEGSAGLTRTRAAVGTVAYMSPEQLRGEDIDHRADLWSLGVLMYELLSGKRPFEGDYEQAVMYSILNEYPVPITKLRPEVSPHVSAVVHRLLARDASERFPDAGSFAAALTDAPERQASSAPATQDVTASADSADGEVSVAVLPFADLSPQSDQLYFCEGMAEEIINALIQVDSIRVTSRSSAFQFAGTAGDIRDIGKRLAVSNIVEGSVRKAANRLRVTVQLTDVERDRRIWSERYDGQLEDVFDMQDAIARMVVDALRRQIGAAEEDELVNTPATDVRAYDFYLRGRHLLYRFGKKNLLEAVRQFSLAVEIDPAYAPAYAGMADTLASLYQEFGKDTSHLERALEASRTAIHLRPGLAEAHSARAIALAWAKQYEEAEREFDVATTLNPRLFEAHYFWARACFTQGKFEEAVIHYEDAAAARPDDYQALTLAASVYAALDRPEDAADARTRALGRIEKRLEISPEDTRALYFGAGCLVELGEVERGLEWVERALERDPEALDTLYNAACVYALAGRPQAAMDCLETTLALGSAASREWVMHDSDLASLKDEPRFQEFLSKLK
jgi:serine/threonine protein kinase/tetratricopeptide (TPR) repeat protein